MNKVISIRIVKAREIMHMNDDELVQHYKNLWNDRYGRDYYRFMSRKTYERLESINREMDGILVEMESRDRKRG